MDNIDPIHLKGMTLYLLAGVALITPIINLIITLMDRSKAQVQKIQPQPLVIKEAIDFASKEDLTRLQTDIETRFRLSCQEIDNQAELDRRARAKIYDTFQAEDRRIQDRVSRAMEMISKLSATSESNAEHIQRVEQDLRDCKKDCPKS